MAKEPKKVDISGLPSAKEIEETVDITGLPGFEEEVPKVDISGLPSAAEIEEEAGIEPEGERDALPSPEKAATVPQPEALPEVEEGGLLERVKLPKSFIDAVAKKHGLDRKQVVEMAQWMGSDLEEEVDKDYVSQLGGQLRKITGTLPFVANLPYKTIKKFTASDAENRAIDDLYIAANKSRPWIETLTDVVAGGGPAVKGAKAVAAAVTKGAAKKKAAIDLAKSGALGGALGFMQAGTDNEAGGTALGATLGIALPLGVNKLIARTKGPKQAFDVEKNVSRIMKERLPQESAKADIILGKGLSQEAKDIAQNIPETKITKEISEGLGVPIEEAKVVQFTSQVEREAKEFVNKYLAPRDGTIGKVKSGKEAIESLQKVIEKEKGDTSDILNKWKNYRYIKTAEQYIIDKNLKMNPSFFDKMKTMTDGLVGPQFVMARLDKKFGTTSEATLSNLSEAVGKFENHAGRLYQAYRNPMVKQIRASKINPNVLREAVESGKIPEGLPEAQKAVIKNYTETMKKFLDEAKEAGLNIKGLEQKGYFRRQMLQGPQLISAVERKADDIAQKFGDLNNQEVFKAAKKNSEFREFLDGLRILGDKPIKSWKEAGDVVTQLESSWMNSTKLGTMAKAAQERTGKIPDFILEKDPIKVMDTWIDNTIKHAYIRKPLDDLVKHKEIFAKLGDTDGAEYINKLAGSLTGSQGGILPEAMQGVAKGMKLATQRSIDELEAKIPTLTGVEKAKAKFELSAIKGAKAVPEVWDMTRKMWYPQLLGWNVKAPIRNLSQPFVMTATEIGGTYGQKLAAEGVIKSAGNYKKIIKRLKEEGKIVDRLDRDNFEAFEKGLRQGWIGRGAEKAIDTYGKAGMYLFQLSDSINRAVTSNMADRLARDYQKGVRGAKDFVEEKLAPSYRTLLSDGKISVKEAVERHLLDRTQFNYNKANISAFGRAIGPTFRMFSKWPAEVLGDMRDKIIQGKAEQAFNKYLGPLAAFSVVDQVFQDSKKEPRYKALMGGGPAARKAPITAAEALDPTKFFDKPALRVGKDTMDAIVNGFDEKSRKKFLRTMDMMYIPSGPIDLFMKDLPSIIGGEPLIEE